MPRRACDCSQPAMDELQILSGDDVVRVRRQVRVAAAAGGLSLVDQTKLVTAASELARNALIHGGGGVAMVETVTSRNRPHRHQGHLQ